MLHFVRHDPRLLCNLLERHTASLFLCPPKHGFDKGHEVEFLSEEGDRGGENFLRPTKHESAFPVPARPEAESHFGIKLRARSNRVESIHVSAVETKQKATQPFLVGSREAVQNWVHEEFAKVVEAFGKKGGKCQIVCTFENFGFRERFHVGHGGKVEEGGGIELQELCLCLDRNKEKHA